ncbi:response regulator [Desulfobacterales bacterium HSG16]|nr:response regulator [Desulfobacterales bacterium HSG16]
MIDILIIRSDKDSLSDFTSAMEKHENISISGAGSGAGALELVSSGNFHLVITDETLEDMTGLALARKLVMTNPMINCAVVSSLSHEDFHEASEGLGLLDPLPAVPGEKEAEELLQNLKNILNMTGDGFQ